MRFTLILCEGTSTRIGLYNKQVTLLIQELVTVIEGLKYPGSQPVVQS